ncbi:MAG: DNA polymerase III subunit gamma/tau, partial [Oscillospiraceae bacterium]|nr:DNA polymerase III subunit gamma/tau [Oscillospiraceae bacterium]
MYLALYRKYRPQVFSDVISQEHITTTLMNQLKDGQTSHAYLFTGSRGTGKTTCAKILAKAINCLDTKDGNPCLECEACRAVAEETPDVVEIDAASNTSVDDVRNLKEEAVYTPLSCRYKVYIIDEVHMLSTAAFNALLKLIEEPPPHVVFIFATTETHKVPATILSRCQRFDFRRIDIEDSKKRLLEIAEKEGMKLDEEAAFLISRISDGGMRDALSLLDQCFAASDHVTEEIVRSCSGISGTDHLFEIADAVIEKDSSRAIMVLDGLVQRSKSPVRLMEELVSHYRILMLLKAGAQRSVLRISADEEKQYLQQNQKYSMESILRAISIISAALAARSRSGNEQLTCEMCLIKLCMPALDVDEKQFSGRIDALERKVAGISAVPQSQNTDGLLERVESLERTVKGLAMSSLQESLKSDIFNLSSSDISPVAFSEEEEAPVSLAEALAAVSPDEPQENGEYTAPEEVYTEDEIIPLPFEEPAAEPMPVPLPFEEELPPPSVEYAAPEQPEPFAPVAEEAFPAEPVAQPLQSDDTPSLQEVLAAEEKPAAVYENDDPDCEPWMKKKEEDEEPSEEGYQPFREWKDILDTLGYSAKMLFGDTTALISEHTLMVCGTEMQKNFAVKDFAEDIKTAVSRAIGRKVGIVAQKGEKVYSDEENYVKDFLGYAKS